jgi:hypothetical protein
MSDWTSLSDEEKLSRIEKSKRHAEAARALSRPDAGGDGKDSNNNPQPQKNQRKSAADVGDNGKDNKQEYKKTYRVMKYSGTGCLTTRYW